MTDLGSPGFALHPVYLSGSGRDLWTADGGTATELGTAGLSATIEMVARIVRHIVTLRTQLRT